jgi:hypothetical protein
MFLIVITRKAQIERFVIDKKRKNLLLLKIKKHIMIKDGKLSRIFNILMSDDFE